MPPGTPWVELSLQRRPCNRVRTLCGIPCGRLCSSSASHGQTVSVPLRLAAGVGRVLHDRNAPAVCLPTQVAAPCLCRVVHEVTMIRGGQHATVWAGRVVRVRCRCPVVPASSGQTCLAGQYVCMSEKEWVCGRSADQGGIHSLATSWPRPPLNVCVAKATPATDDPVLQPFLGTQWLVVSLWHPPYLMVPS